MNNSSKNKERAERAEHENGKKKMVLIEKAMHGDKAGIRESKNYKGKCGKSCKCSKCK